MSDCKELITNLRKFGMCLYGDETSIMQTAADAIEELVTKCQQLEKEKDTARLTAKKLLETAQRLKKERDAAVAEISLYHYCRSCKHSDVGEEKEPCMSCNQCWAGKEKCNWEWRGVKDE